MGKEKEQSNELKELCQSAFYAEYRKDFAKAYALHTQSIAALNKFISSCGFFDGDAKGTARKQIKFHTNRIQLIAPLAKGAQAPLPIIIPTAVAAQDDLGVLRNGYPCLTAQEMWLATYAKEKAANPNAQPGKNLTRWLKFGEPIPFFTPTLDPALPPTTFHIYVKREVVFGGTEVFYYKAKSDAKTPPRAGAGGDPEGTRETLYVLKARKPKQYQIAQAVLHRASEFQTAAAVVTIQPVKLRALASGYGLMHTGRDLELRLGTGRLVRETMDRADKSGWGPRRFTYGARQFVWVTEGEKESVPQTCYEVERVWAKDGSQTGKQEHKLVACGPGGQPRRLCWGEPNMKLKKTAVIHMAGGLDQLFMEHLLASQLTRWAVLWHGHNH